MMKRLLILVVAALLIAAPALARQPVKPAAAPVPRVLSYVLDSGKALDAEQLKDLKSAVAMNEMRTGVQTIVVVAPSMGGGTISSFTAEVKETIKFAAAGKPAVLFLVAVKEKAAIITATANVPGLTASAQNAIVQRIVLPNFRLDKINTGIYDGTRAITLALQVPSITQAAEVEDPSAFWSRWIPLIVLSVFLVGFGNSDWNRGTSYRSGRYGGGSRTY